MISSQDGTDARRGLPGFLAGPAAWTGALATGPLAAAALAGGVSGWPAWADEAADPASSADGVTTWAGSRLLAGAGPIRRSTSRAWSG